MVLVLQLVLMLLVLVMLVVLLVLAVVMAVMVMWMMADVIVVLLLLLMLGRLLRCGLHSGRLQVRMLQMRWQTVQAVHQVLLLSVPNG